MDQTGLLHRTRRMPALALCPAATLAKAFKARDGLSTRSHRSQSKNNSGTAEMPDASHSPSRQLDVAIVGGGLAGVYAVHRLRGMGLQVRAYEAGSGVGGTWFWNRYPGARCDVESLEYSYSFSEELQQDWDWPERFAAQPDILRYINHVADRLDLRRFIVTETRTVADPVGPRHD